MLVEKSAGIIIFRKTKKETEYLLIHAPAVDKWKASWGLPKGHIEKGENSEDAAIRETKEETGITKLRFISGFKKTTRYFFMRGGKKVLKFNVYFLAQTNQKNVIISWEHDQYAWLSYTEALKTISFTNSKNILKKAHEYLSSHSK